MDDTRFTRETWRPGKRRKTWERVKPWGGQTRAPERFLAMSKLVAIGGPLDKRARCAGKRHDGGACRNIAMTGSTFCLRHGGARGAKRVRVYVPQGRRTPRDAREGSTGE